MNFARGEEGEPTLLSLDDARTLFHEFGHGLHGLLSDVTYPSISGTSVSRDFVELPSQLYEHWLMVPEVLQRFALHHETGKPMPAKLAAAHQEGAQLQPGLLDRRVRGFRAGRHGAARAARGGGARRRHFRAHDAEAARHAARDRHAPPHPALPAHHGRLCGGLLQLPVVGGDGRRRVRRPSRRRATLSIRRRRSG